MHKSPDLSAYTTSPSKGLETASLPARSREKCQSSFLLERDEQERGRMCGCSLPREKDTVFSEEKLCH